MFTRYIFHLSIPVSDLAQSAAFYVDALGAASGRRGDAWQDVLLWGHQITLQLRPSEVLPLASQGKRHFGVTLPWREWETTVSRLRSAGISFLEEPKVLYQGLPEEQAKFYVVDPSNNVIEIKTYRDPSGTLAGGDSAYKYVDA